MMPKPAYFIQECPTCGRRLEIRVEYLGRVLVCRHCQGRFEASSRSADDEMTESSSVLLRRADDLLQRASQQRSMGS